MGDYYIGYSERNDKTRQFVEVSCTALQNAARRKVVRKPKREERKDSLSTVGYSVTVGRVLTSRRSYRQEAEGERYVGVSESMVFSPSVSGSEPSRRMQSFLLDESHGA